MAQTLKKEQEGQESSKKKKKQRAITRKVHKLVNEAKKKSRKIKKAGGPLI